jgi:hypothetical protein
MEGMEVETNERLSQLRAIALVQKDPEILWAIEAEVNYLLAIRDEVWFRSRLPSKAASLKSDRQMASGRKSLLTSRTNPNHEHRKQRM